MKKILLFSLLLLLCARGAALAVEASESPSARPLTKGGSFPDVHLTGALTPGQAASLGLAEAKPPYALSGIAAEVLIVEIFSMYCPHCQREAPVLNELSRLIEQRGLAGKIKLIGVGVGNSAFEVDTFRKKYNVTWPLFDDADFAVHKAVGSVGTPYFYVLKKQPGGFTVVLTSLGRMASPEAFLGEVVRAAGI